MASITDRKENPDINIPTITYPNGGESIFSRVITITWVKPPQPSNDGSNVTYELFFTSEYDDSVDNGWIQIASIPSSSQSFRWNVPFAIHSQKCRVGIRARDHKGNRTQMTISAADFSIQERSLATPAVTSPTESGSYHEYVPFILDHKGLEGTYSQRATYQIYYSSDSNEIDWTTIAENVPVGSSPFLWDIRDLPPGTDYAIKVILMDDNDKSSLPVYIRNVKLTPLNYFLLDTTPPKGKVYVEGNSEFIKDRNLVLRLTAFDETTGIKSVVLRQRADGNDGASTEQEMANVKTFLLDAEEDGRYCVESLFKDYAGNTPTSDELTEFFRRYVTDSNSPIDAFLLVDNGDSQTAYTAFGGESRYLFENTTELFRLDSYAYALAYMDGIVYIGLTTSDNKGFLQKIEEGISADVYEFTTPDSSITCMEVFKDQLYIGCENGELYVFSGTTVTLVTSFDSSITTMSADGNVLYLFIQNAEAVKVYNGTTFTDVVITNGNIQVPA